MEPVADGSDLPEAPPADVVNSLRFLREAWRPFLLKPSDEEIEEMKIKAAVAEEEADAHAAKCTSVESPGMNQRLLHQGFLPIIGAMELFGTAWDGYSAEERQHAANLRVLDVIGIPLFCPWYLFLGKLFSQEDALYEVAPDALCTVLRLVLALAAVLVLLLHSQAVPKPTKEADAFHVQRKLGYWVYLTRHCIAFQAWHQVLTLLAPFSPMLGAATNGLCISVGGLGWFVTMQYFSLVVPADGFKEECKKWAERGVAFGPVQHALHIPPFFIGALDLFLRPSALLARSLNVFSCLRFGAFYVVVYVAVFFGNYQLTGKWPYAFMDAFGTDVAKWSKFITVQAGRLSSV
ncbi:unnamed protein product [Symbiodinium natans]|uniref:Uncharacterized protein n=1 Tax=Symbiodinium natans TaxID=878477 RepID=A0A812R5C1_9DINO|nr:unnamed protein product [Symbiodinium natans]